MAKRRADSNQTIFRVKDSSRTRPAAMTKIGYAAFERARAKLAGLVGRSPDRVSDADTIEALSRGDKDTIRHLKATGQFAGQDTRM